jgi:hypothetical protein
VHTFGSDEVNWFKPTHPPEPCSGENDVVISQYDDDWQIPAENRRNSIPGFLEEVAWKRSSGNVSSFVIILAEEVTSLSRIRVEYDLLIATLAIGYTDFLSELKTSHSLATRSRFRVNRSLRATSSGLEPQ